MKKKRSEYCRNKLYLIFLITIIFAFPLKNFAQEKRLIESNFNGTYKAEVQTKYLLYLPVDYSDNNKFPLLLFLHGAGERGDDLSLVKKLGPPKMIAEGKEFPFVVVSPQCPVNKRWDTKVLIALIDEIVAKYKIDEDRIYVTGLSMGGNGTWRLATEIPDRLAAVIPICG
ncbi:MAG: phospholipase, partial [Ignavibacteria bacterium]|nr:phospholipase [Ignavibacteria bacterium]